MIPYFSGIIGGGQTDGQTHPYGVSLSMSCPLSESPHDPDYPDPMGR
jgi:hypothetical protein